MSEYRISDNKNNAMSDIEKNGISIGGLVTSGIVALMTVVSFLSTRSLFMASNIKVNLHDEIFIDQSYGVLSFSQLISTKNVGSKLGSITRIESQLKFKEDSSVCNKKFIAKYYSSSGCSQCNGDLFNFDELYVAPGSFFATNIRSYEIVNTNTSDTIDYLQKTFAKEIIDKDLKDSMSRTKVFNATDSTKKKIGAFINNRLSVLKQGWYTFKVAIEFDDNPSYVKTYTFYLRKEDIALLYDSILDNEQLYWQPIVNTGNFIKIRLDN
ncbi:hypothetical protein [Mucilaginibacter ginsenosidivorans]|uniref:Uncharacterized protein n=1 Tax=Mucilaginibacter ginsenosidivorans TaxID=398053 RepID=A0A5B8UTF8_9SPHI|nr:hypothetical protein [Mucilaginibacter ginsenosidivorans]QEC61746.1 hypothetical protein FRZ54_03815 [Mucilaginibacter ginsenosidivorans]